MKTDRFTDIIRRKLESIRPEFTDKDWARMQATLKDANLSQPSVPDANHPFSGGVWSSGKSWLLAAASVSSVILVAFSMWQQREINHLRQEVGQLHKHPTNQPAPAPSNPALTEQLRPDVAHSEAVTSSKQNPESITLPNRNAGQSERPDTVYITRYVPTPTRPQPETRTEEHLTQRVETPTEQQSTKESPEFPSATTRQSTTLNKTQQSESYDASSTPSVANNTRNESGINNKLTTSPVRDKNSMSRVSGKRDRKRSDAYPSDSPDNTNSEVVSNGNARNTNNAATNNGVTTNGNTKGRSNVVPAPAEAIGQSESTAAVNETSAKYEPVSGLPLSVGNKNWNAALTQYAKRMRPARPAVAVEQKKTPAIVESTPASQPVQQPATRFRVGAGGEVASRLWSVGLFTEILLGKHWALSAGLSQAIYTNTFINDEDFNNRTKHDFRKEVVRGVDPWREIMNIDTRQQRVQIPISLGYRIPLSGTLTLLPTIGTYFTLTNSEDITFYCRKPMLFPQQPQRGFEELSASRRQSVNMLNSLALSTGIEWQQGHWVIQGSPVLTIATKTNPQTIQTDLNWQNNTTIGLRARLLYQF